jgi:sodium/bile acid cotransporter 7
MLNGLALFFAMPTTISSGVVLTGQAKGSKAMALFFSVSTNILAVFTCPGYLSVLLRSDSAGGGSSIDVVSILWKLSLTVCLPLFVGKLMQLIPNVTETAKAWKPQIKLASSLFLVLIPWMKVSQASPELGELAGETVAAVIGIGAGVHLVLLALSGGTALLLPISNANRKAIIISGSQKTIAIAAAFLALLPESMDPGVMVIPAIISHFAQIVIDAFVATWLVTALPTQEEDDAGSDSATKSLSGTTEGAGTSPAATSHSGALESASSTAVLVTRA